jgi:methyl-accepting chemotaxis protein
LCFHSAVAATHKIQSHAGRLADAMLNVSSVAQQSSTSTELMAASSSEVTGAIENLASISEENSAAIEEVSASAEEVSAQVIEMTASIQFLSDLAATLQNDISRFKLASA